MDSIHIICDRKEMYFEFPDGSEPFFPRFFLLFFSTLEAILGIFLPIAAAVFLITWLCFVCLDKSGILGLFPDDQKCPAPVQGQSGFTDPTDTIEDVKRLEVEMELLEEMLRAREKKMEQLIKNGSSL